LPLVNLNLKHKGKIIMNILAANSYLFISLILLVLVIVALFFRVKLSLFFTRLIWSRYSFNYFSLYSKYFPLKFPSAIKYEPWEYLRSFLDINCSEEYISETEIKFNGYKLGKSVTNFHKKNGKPNYLSISSREEKNLSILVSGYNKLVYMNEATLIYFFAGPILIMGQYRFKREKQNVNYSYLKEKLLEKYQLSEIKNLDRSDKFMIRDKKDNQLFVKDNGFDVEVSIFNPKIALFSKELFLQSESYLDNLSTEAAGITF